jgi:hypothetical protein
MTGCAILLYLMAHRAGWFGNHNQERDERAKRLVIAANEYRDFVVGIKDAAGAREARKREIEMRNRLVDAEAAYVAGGRTEDGDLAGEARRALDRSNAEYQRFKVLADKAAEEDREKQRQGDPPPP